MVLGSFSPTHRISNKSMHQTSQAAPQPLVMSATLASLRCCDIYFPPFLSLCLRSGFELRYMV
jgi:hypothetical protein